MASGSARRGWSSHWSVACLLIIPMAATSIVLPSSAFVLVPMVHLTTIKWQRSMIGHG